jgi:hypothetical protein
VVFLVALAVIIISSGYFSFLEASKRSKKGAEEIMMMIKAGKGQQMAKDIKDLDAYKPEDRKALQVAVKHHVQEFNLELISFEMRGHLTGDMVFSLEYKAGEDYPDGEKYHYYRIPYSMFTGWDITEMHRTNEDYYNSAIWRKQGAQR